MTDDKPGSSRKPGLAAVALFGVLAAIILSSASGFAPATGFPAGESIVHNIGYALFDIELGEIASEGFLAAFLIIALALDVALDSAIYLAKQEDEGTIISALTDGGRDVSGNIDNNRGGDS
ncbi:NADH-quinone oxidoreductase subunit J [Halohasta litchfieldiae]|jgi:NADH-quinone oxidoreductase subunit J|uniref:NADH-quinone oxidoreductase subunit J n=1 Tax=Halohasta litchfieldiae TaxID=1073996 RepID=A0A1H6RDI4_9EURY|nr:hypothetical protein [Halohasta litchfieldiae]ATW89799.1 NADH-quinone oxidoreductase subunit J [Halohasta litchfieldiae]SEI52546.1 NADH-quinone oxidoreductase subunit J [Halohasta litchfieldiae]